MDTEERKKRNKEQQAGNEQKESSSRCNFFSLNDIPEERIRRSVKTEHLDEVFISGGVGKG